MNGNRRIRVAVVGAAGFSGLELLKWLQRHPQVELGTLTSARYAGQTVSQAFPQLQGIQSTFSPHETDLQGHEVIFLAVPETASLEKTPSLLNAGMRVIDLSGAFRLPAKLFQIHYQLSHSAPGLLSQAVYGLPEMMRKQLHQACLVANPGCYPTAVLLALLPMASSAQHWNIAPLIDAKSGISGAGGRSEDTRLSFSAIHDNCYAYKVFNHQHTPEITHQLASHTNYDPQQQGTVRFSPHVLPLHRGLLCSIYLSFHQPQDKAEMRARYEAFAAKEPFVVLLEANRTASLQMAQHTNRCILSLHSDDSGCQWTIYSALDNLTKGAASQALQNFNLICGLEETMGLEPLVAQ